MTILVDITLLPGAEPPTYATDGSGAFDFYFHSLQGERSDLLGPTSIIVGTGVSMKVPEDHVLLLFSRSGHGILHQISLSNGVGVVDSDYTGEIVVGLTVKRTPSMSSGKFALEGGLSLEDLAVGNRICQGIILPRPRIEFDILKTLPTTVRGTGGLGSTGA